MARSGPPAYAWDWFARQRLLWREARRRLTEAASPAAVRYHAVETRADAIALLRADYPRDPVVRDAVHRVVAEVAFLGRTGDAAFADLGLRNPPRGLAWWWTALTGEETTGVEARRRRPADDAPSEQLQLDAFADSDPTGLDPPTASPRTDDMTDDEATARARVDDVQLGWGG